MKCLQVLAILTLAWDRRQSYEMPTSLAFYRHQFVRCRSRSRRRTSDGIEKVRIAIGITGAIWGILEPKTIANGNGTRSNASHHASFRFDCHSLFDSDVLLQTHFQLEALGIASFT
jgi:hypothetical protein